MFKKITGNLRKIALFTGAGGMTLTLVATILTGNTFGFFTAFLVFFIMTACVLASVLTLMFISKALESKKNEISTEADIQRNLCEIEAKLGISAEQPVQPEAVPAEPVKPAEQPAAPVFHEAAQPVEQPAVPVFHEAAQPVEKPAVQEAQPEAEAKEIILCVVADTFLKRMKFRDTTAEIAAEFTQRYGSLPHDCVKKFSRDLQLAVSAEANFGNMKQRVLEKMEEFFYTNLQLFAEDESGKTYHCPVCLMAQDANAKACSCCGTELISDAEAEKNAREAFLKKIEAMETGSQIVDAFMHTYANRGDSLWLVNDLMMAKNAEGVFGNMKEGVLTKIRQFFASDMKLHTPIEKDGALVCPQCGRAVSLDEKACRCGAMFLTPDMKKGGNLLNEVAAFTEYAECLNSCAEITLAFKERFGSCSIESIQKLGFLLDQLVSIERTYGNSPKSALAKLRSFVDHNMVIYTVDKNSAMIACPACNMHQYSSVESCRQCGVLFISKEDEAEALRG